MSADELAVAVGATLDGHRTATLAARANRTLYVHIRHELRTPLNAIIGYSEMLLEDIGSEDGDGVGPDLLRINAAGKELLSLVDAFLNPARIEAGQLDMDLETVGADLRAELRTPLNAVVGYSEMLLEQAAEAGHDALSSDLERIRAAAQRFLDFVNDIGALAQPHGAEAAGPLPLADDVATAMIASVVTTMTAMEEDAARAQTVTGRILVVDDNAINRDMLSRRLEREGHSVAVAEDGRQALAMIGAQSFDLILLDIMMPGMNGYEVLQHLKGRPASRDVPVIMISALDEVESVVRCIEMGAEDYLPKPFNPVLLRARIGASLEKKHLRDQQVLYLRQIEAEKQRADGLLRVILPDEIVEELTLTNEVKPRRYDHVAVLFCDIVGFTTYCDTHDAQEVIANLQLLVEAFEEIALRHNLQKVKTIGDSFMAVAGLLRPVKAPVMHCIRCGQEMIAAAQALPAQWNVRVGIHVGPVVAGVIGRRQYLFDLWGDSVNTAARMESHGIAGAITLSKAAWRDVAARCHGHSLGMVAIKGKGQAEMYRFDGLKARQGARRPPPAAQ